MEENLKVNQVESETEETQNNKNGSSSFIKDFFIEEQAEKIKDLADLFGQSEAEIKKEFGNFKAKKIYKKLNYFIDNRFRLSKDLKSCLELAVKHEFYGVTVFQSAMEIAKNTILGSKVKLRVLVNYPQGEDDFNTVKCAVKLAKRGGADEIAVMLSAFYYRNYDSLETVKRVKKLLRVARNKKLVIILDSANLSRIEIENAIKTLISSGVYNILIANSKARLDRDALNDAIKLCTDKVFIECLDKISLAEPTVSILTSGVDFLTSEYAPEIVTDLNDKINANTESGCKPLDKTDKE